MNTSTFLNRILLAGFLPLAFSFTLVANAADQPPLPLKRAIDLAEQALADKGVAGQVYIQAIALEHTSTIGGRIVWSITWSGPVPAKDPAKKEVGIEIGMDGNVVHLVRGPGEPPKHHGPR